MKVVSGRYLRELVAEGEICEAEHQSRYATAHIGVRLSCGCLSTPPDPVPVDRVPDVGAIRFCVSCDDEAVVTSITAQLVDD